MLQINDLNHLVDPYADLGGTTERLSSRPTGCETRRLLLWVPVGLRQAPIARRLDRKLP